MNWKKKPATSTEVVVSSSLAPVDKLRALVTSRAILGQLQEPSVLLALQTLLLLVLSLALLVHAISAL